MQAAHHFRFYNRAIRTEIGQGLRMLLLSTEPPPHRILDLLHALDEIAGPDPGFHDSGLSELRRSCTGALRINEQAPFQCGYRKHNFGSRKHLRCDRPNEGLSEGRSRYRRERPDDCSRRLSMQRHRRTAIVGVITVLSPLPRVPNHVVQPETVSRKTSNGRCVSVTVIARRKNPILFSHHAALRRLVGAVAIVAQVLVVIAEPIPWVCPGLHMGPRRIFPFRFSQESVRLAGFACHPCDIRFGVVPAQTHRRVRRSLGEAGIAP
jgi:hypothetical protein